MPRTKFQPGDWVIVSPDAPWRLYRNRGQLGRVMCYGEAPVGSYYGRNRMTGQWEHGTVRDNIYGVLFYPPARDGWLATIQRHRASVPRNPQLRYEKVRCFATAPQSMLEDPNFAYAIFTETIAPSLPEVIERDYRELLTFNYLDTG